MYYRLENCNDEPKASIKAETTNQDIGASGNTAGSGNTAQGMEMNLQILFSTLILSLLTIVLYI